MDEEMRLAELEAKIAALEELEKKRADEAEKAMRDEKYRLSMLGHENNRWDFSDAMYLLPTDPNNNDIRLQQAAKNFFLMIDRWGIHPDFIKCFPNVINNNSFEWYDPVTKKPLFWQGDGVVTDWAAYDGTYSLKLMPGETHEQGYLDPIYPGLEAGSDPAWWNNYQTRCSFRQKGGAVRVKIDAYSGTGEDYEWDTLTSWHSPQTGTISEISLEKKANGKLIFVSIISGEVYEGEVDSVDVLLSGSNTVNNWKKTGITTNAHGRCCVFRADKDLWLSVAQAGSASIPAWYKLYKSPSGNGGDWTLYSTVYSGTTATNDFINLGTATAGAITVLDNGRYVLCGPWWHVRYTSYRAQAPAVWTSDDKGLTWSFRMRGTWHVAGGYYFHKSSSRHVVRSSSGALYFAHDYDAGTWGTRVWRSTDNGTSWTTAYYYNSGWYNAAPELMESADGGIYLFTSYYGRYVSNSPNHVYYIPDPDNSSARELLKTTANANINGTHNIVTQLDGKLIWCSSFYVLGVDAKGYLLTDNSEEGLIDKYGQEVGIVRSGYYLDYPYIENWAQFVEGKQDLSEEAVKYLVTGYRTFYFQPKAGKGKVKFHFENIDPTDPVYIDMVQMHPDFTGKWGMFETLGKRSIAPGDILGMPGLGGVQENPVTGEIELTPNPHASSHATGGSDELTPADIGAAEEVHVHDNLKIHQTVEIMSRGGLGANEPVKTVTGTVMGWKMAKDREFYVSDRISVLS